MTEEEMACMKSSIKRSSTMMQQSKRNQPFFRAFWVKQKYGSENEQLQHHINDDETCQNGLEQKHELPTVSGLLKIECYRSLRMSATTTKMRIKATMV